MVWIFIKLLFEYFWQEKDGLPQSRHHGTLNFQINLHNHQALIWVCWNCMSFKEVFPKELLHFQFYFCFALRLLILSFYYWSVINGKVLLNGLQDTLLRINCWFNFYFCWFHFYFLWFHFCFCWDFKVFCQFLGFLVIWKVVLFFKGFNLQFTLRNRCHPWLVYFQKICQHKDSFWMKMII